MTQVLHLLGKYLVIPYRLALVNQLHYQGLMDLVGVPKEIFCVFAGSFLRNIHELGALIWWQSHHPELVFWHDFTLEVEWM